MDELSDLNSEGGHTPSVMEMADRLRRARERAGFRNATEAARRFNWTISTYLAHENGTRGFPKKRALAYAQAFRVGVSWLLTGEGVPESSKRIPIEGYLGAGAVVHAVVAREDGIVDEVDLPPGVDVELLAFRVRGESNYPVYKDGDVIFCARDGQPLHELVNREAVVRTAEGRRYIKTVVRGSRHGLYTLISHNAPPQPDEELDWGAAVLWVKKA